MMCDNEKLMFGTCASEQINVIVMPDGSTIINHAVISVRLLVVVHLPNSHFNTCPLQSLFHRVSLSQYIMHTCQGIIQDLM